MCAGSTRIGAPWAVGNHRRPSRIAHAPGTPLLHSLDFIPSLVPSAADVSVVFAPVATAARSAFVAWKTPRLHDIQRFPAWSSTMA